MKSDYCWFDLVKVMLYNSCTKSLPYLLGGKCIKNEEKKNTLEKVTFPISVMHRGHCKFLKTVFFILNSFVAIVLHTLIYYNCANRSKLGGKNKLSLKIKMADRSSGMQSNKGIYCQNFLSQKSTQWNKYCGFNNKWGEKETYLCCHCYVLWGNYN